MKSIMARDHVFEELAREVEYYSPHTKSQYFSHVSDYLDYVGSGDWRDRDILYNYLPKLKKKGLSQSHINYIIRGPIGAVFRAHGLRIPIKLPRANVSHNILDLASRIQFTPEEVIKIIKAARHGTLQQKAVFAISTTFGPRMGEIKAIRGEDDVHPKRKTLVIHTLKQGLMREHLVPPQVQSYIFGYHYPPASENQLRQLFDEVLEVAGIKRMPRKVYHAIRHSLGTNLVYHSGIQAEKIYNWMGWKAAGQLGIYSTPYLPELDKEIFEKHPFLEYWG